MPPPRSNTATVCPVRVRPVRDTIRSFGGNDWSCAPCKHVILQNKYTWPSKPILNETPKDIKTKYNGKDNENMSEGVYLRKFRRWLYISQITKKTTKNTPDKTYIFSIRSIHARHQPSFLNGAPVLSRTRTGGPPPWAPPPDGPPSAPRVPRCAGPLCPCCEKVFSYHTAGEFRWLSGGNWKCLSRPAPF